MRVTKLACFMSYDIRGHLGEELGTEVAKRSQAISWLCCATPKAYPAAPSKLLQIFARHALWLFQPGVVGTSDDSSGIRIRPTPTKG